MDSNDYRIAYYHFSIEEYSHRKLIQITPHILKSNDDWAYENGPDNADAIIRDLKEHGIECKNKKILDVGMGHGYTLHYMKEFTNADVYGYDLFDYLIPDNFIKDRTFVETDVRDMDSSLIGTFDVAYQDQYSVPFFDTISVLQAISKSLKSNGAYYLRYANFEAKLFNGYVLDILNALYNNVVYHNYGFGKTPQTIIATKPKENPILPSLEEHYVAALFKNEDDEDLVDPDEIWGKLQAKRAKIKKLKLEAKKYANRQLSLFDL
jgi:SAM-dependent methyltransferase